MARVTSDTWGLAANCAAYSGVYYMACFIKCARYGFWKEIVISRAICLWSNKGYLYKESNPKIMKYYLTISTQIFFPVNHDELKLASRPLLEWYHVTRLLASNGNIPMLFMWSWIDNNTSFWVKLPVGNEINTGMFHGPKWSTDTI